MLILQENNFNIYTYILPENQYNSTDTFAQTRVKLGEHLGPFFPGGCHHVGNSDALPCQHGGWLDQFVEGLVVHTVGGLQQH